MRNKVKNVRENLVSVRNSGEVITQNTATISVHNTQKQYRILSKISFVPNSNLETSIINSGVFSTSNNFIVSAEKSVLFFNKNGEMVEKSIPEIIKNSEELFVAVPKVLGYSVKENDVLVRNSQGSINKIPLNQHIGFILGALLNTGTFEEYTNIFSAAPYKKSSLIPNDVVNKYKDLNKDTLLFIDKVQELVKSRSFYKIKKFLYGTNNRFLVGILDGFYFCNELKGETIFLIPDDQFLFFRIIIEVLGGSYKKTFVLKGQHKYVKIQFNISAEFDIKKYSISLPKYFYRKHKYFWNPSTKSIIKTDSNAKFDSTGNQFFDDVNSGNIELISSKDLVFQELQEHEMLDELYDFSMQDTEATNYAFPSLPLLKNSDGDVLNVAALFSENALRDADEFSPMSHIYFRNNNNGEIQNFVQKDALLGIYSGTK